MADLFDIVVARKLSGGGGGGTTVEALSVTQNGTYTAPSGKAYSPVTVNVSGGSSDFSTATVTVSLRGLAYFALPQIVDEGEQGALMVTGVSSGVYEIALYKGYAVCDAPPDVNVTVSGNASLDEDLIYITGDCTITIS